MSKINEALERLGATLLTKNADYKVNDGEFSNFEYAAAIAGGNVETVILTQIGIKLGRLKGLSIKDGEPNFESIQDTIKDLAGYAVILYAYSLPGEMATEGEDESLCYQCGYSDGKHDSRCLEGPVRGAE